MRVGINAVRLTRPFTGVGRYLDRLLAEWSRMPLPFDDVVLFAPRPLDPALVHFPLDRFPLEVIGGGGPDPFWEWRALRRKHREVDLLFCPSYTVPFRYPGPAVVTYFGPATNRRWSKEWWRARVYDALYRHSARRAVRVLTAASWVKRHVVDAYGVAEAKVDVIPLAAGPEFTPAAAPDERARIEQAYLGGQTRYILFVGKLSGRHAVPHLVEAFAIARAATRSAHSLLLVGPNVLGLDVAALARARGLEGAVVHVPFASEADLPALYRAADLFVFPASESEGFGLPILEAMASGTAVVTTSLGSVPEVAAEAALLVPDTSVVALAEGLRRLLVDRERGEDLARRGLERAAQFSWRRTAEATMDALWRAAGGGETMSATWIRRA
jgi:glycosyltransferase involved in cell wall biosynthesis